MSRSAKRMVESKPEPAPIVSRGLRAQRGVHLTIKTLRTAVGKTQTEVAEASRIDQADISRLESREDFGECQVSTLQRYISALGGSLILVATFGNKRIILTGAKRGMATSPKTRRDLERYARTLCDQTNQLVRELGVDVSDAEAFSKHSVAFRQAAGAYERLALAEKRADRVAWERTMVDGRNGSELLDRLWDVREELFRRDHTGRPNAKLGDEETHPASSSEE